jgi:hypothetical protein
VKTQHDEPPQGGLPADVGLRAVTRSPRGFIESDDVPRVLFLIPGAKSLAQWCIEVQCAAKTERWGVDIKIVSYTPPSPWQVVLFPWQTARRLQVKRQLDLMFKELPQHAEVFIAAHSFGTDILTHWLRDHVRDVCESWHIFRIGQRIQGIVLIAGIAKRKYLTDIRQACNVLVNDVAVADRVPSWAAGLAGWAYDDIGTRGVIATTARPIDRFFDGRHGALISVDHFRDNILPLVLGERLPPGRHRGPKVSARYVSRVQMFRDLLLCLLAAGIVSWGGWSLLATDPGPRCLRADGRPCSAPALQERRAQEESSGTSAGGEAAAHAAGRRARSCDEAGPRGHRSCRHRGGDRAGAYGWAWPRRSGDRRDEGLRARLPPWLEAEPE